MDMVGTGRVPLSKKSQDRPEHKVGPDGIFYAPNGFLYLYASLEPVTDVFPVLEGPCPEP